MTPAEKIAQVLEARHCAAGFLSEELWDEVCDEVGLFPTKPAFLASLQRMAASREIDRLEPAPFRYWAKGRMPAAKRAAAVSLQPTVAERQGPPLVKELSKPAITLVPPARAAALAEIRQPGPSELRARERLSDSSLPVGPEVDLMRQAAPAVPLPKPKAMLKEEIILQVLADHLHCGSREVYGYAPQLGTLQYASSILSNMFKEGKVAREQNGPTFVYRLPSQPIWVAPVVPDKVGQAVGACACAVDAADLAGTPPALLEQLSKPVQAMATAPGPRIVAGFVIEDVPVAPKTGKYWRAAAQAMRALQVGQSIVLTGRSERGYRYVYERTRADIGEEMRFLGVVEGENFRIGRTA